MIILKKIFPELSAISNKEIKSRIIRITNIKNCSSKKRKNVRPKVSEACTKAIGLDTAGTTALELFYTRNTVVLKVGSSDNFFESCINFIKI